MFKLCAAYLRPEVKSMALVRINLTLDMLCCLEHYEDDIYLLAQQHIFHYTQNSYTIHGNACLESQKHIYIDFMVYRINVILFFLFFWCSFNNTFYPCLRYIVAIYKYIKCFKRWFHNHNQCCSFSLYIGRSGGENINFLSLLNHCGTSCESILLCENNGSK